MPQSIQSPYTHVWSDHDFTRALAVASNTNHAKLPIDADEWLKVGITGNHLIVLDALLGNAKYRNAYSWRETLKDMEKKWFLPLHTALKKGKIKRLTITSLDENLSQEYVITRSNLWKFWLMSKSLFSYVPKH